LTSWASLHREVLDQLDALLAVADDPGPFPTALTPVSGWSALEHAEHMAQADAGSMHQLETALTRDGGPRLKLAGRLVLALGWIPRGVGKAPSTSRPEARDREQVAAALRAVRDRIAAVGDRLGEVAAGRGRASHPIFGGLTPARWLRFLRIHHHHHLKIIEDIRAAYEASAK
jgi:hypothetical protein